MALGGKNAPRRDSLTRYKGTVNLDTKDGPRSLTGEIMFLSNMPGWVILQTPTEELRIPVHRIYSLSNKP
jgi:hypothetical protein